MLVLHLPMTTREACDAASAGWGQPAFVADIAFERLDDRSAVHVSDGGARILDLSVDEGGPILTVRGAQVAYAASEGRLVCSVMPSVARQQVRFADGTPGFVESAGDRYGIGIEGQSTSAALDALDSWNICVTVTDVGGGSVSAYDEFGFFRYTYIGSAGLPGGGSIYGSGPPNTVVILQPNNQDVTFSSNCPYQVRVSVTDLWNAPHTQVIAASTLQVYGGTMSGWEGFSVAGDYIWLIGTEPLGYQAPQYSLTYTTTSSADFNPDPQLFQMACTIPTVPEDRYFGVLTFSVVHE